MDQPGVWLQNCALGRRSIGLEKASTQCRLQSHHQNGSRRLDYSGARHSSRHDRGDAVRAEPARGQGLQIRDRFRIDRDANATAAETFAISKIDPAKIDISFPHSARLIVLPA